jgi:hypothetical protein
MNNRVSGNRNLVKNTTLFQFRKGESPAKMKRFFTFIKPSEEQLEVIKRANRIYKKRYRLKMLLSLSIAVILLGIAYWIIFVVLLG